MLRAFWCFYLEDPKHKLLSPGSSKLSPTGPRRLPKRVCSGFRSLNLDFSKAYKHIPTKIEHRSLAVILCRGEFGEDQLFHCELNYAWPHGFSVFLCENDSDRNLHKLTIIFELPNFVSFDVFPMLATISGSVTETDSMISEFLDLLGWFGV